MSLYNAELHNKQFAAPFLTLHRNKIVLEVIQFKNNRVIKTK